MSGWNRLFNYQRDALVQLIVWTTEADRRRALSYVDRQPAAHAVVKAIEDGLPMPQDVGLIVAIARYEDAGWMPDGRFDRWRRWIFNGIERKSADDLVLWLGDVETRMRQVGVVEPRTLRSFSSLSRPAASR